MFVIIAEPPNSPDNLTILSVTSRTARISWSISRAEPKIERFVVQWKRQDGNTSCSFSLNNDMNHNGWMSYGPKKIIYCFFKLQLLYYCDRLTLQVAGRSRLRRRRCTARWRRPSSPPSGRPPSTRSESQRRMSWAEVRRGEFSR